MANRVFFQDFLFENLPVNEQDMPCVSIEILQEKRGNLQLIEIPLDRLLRMNTLREWNRLFEQVKGRDVCIVDDVDICNEELLPYKKFYVETYFYNLSLHCGKCYLSNKP